RFQVWQVFALGVDKIFPAKENMGIGVVGDLVAALQQPVNEFGTVDGTAVGILGKVRIVVVGHAAPGGGSVLALMVWIVVGGVAHHVKGAAGAVLLQCFR